LEEGRDGGGEEMRENKRGACDVLSENYLEPPS